MSELKTYNSERIYWAVEQVEREAGDIEDLHLDDTLFYLKSEADEVISTIRAERDEYRYNLSCARNEIHNMQALMRDDIKTIAELKADYKEACDRLQTANLIKDEQLVATRHHKFKRCLDKAEWCEERSARYDLLQERTGFDWSREIGFYFKWQQRWLELAEQFEDKETK